MPMTVVDLMVVLAMALAGAMVIISSLRFRRNQSAVKAAAGEKAAVALFKDGRLIDATAAAVNVFGNDDSTLLQAVDRLGPEFPDLRQIVDRKRGWHGQIVSIKDAACFIDLTCVNDTIRMQFHGNIRLETDDTSLLDDIGSYAPQLIWQTDRVGKTVWSNDAYQTEMAQRDVNFEWPVEPVTTLGHSQAERVMIAGDTTRWYDVTSVARRNQTLHFATDVTAIMRADEERRDFVQALGKTFAALSIGLAIFDKNRQLAMFNPALLDMTRLPVGFLSALPKIDTVLDRLREMQMMPEPKNYATWRDQFTAVETAAKDGTYSENWSLPDGQTFRVTGRPHPDGAFALLFEDITAEISLTRRFRSDIETGQAVLDTLPDAIAVFSGAGTMVVSNHAYGKLWDVGPELMLEHREVSTEITNWQDSCIASPIWTEMRNFIQRIGTRKPWADDAMLVDGRHVRCHAIPIAGGMTMVKFVIAPPMRPIIQKLTRADPAIMAHKG